MRGGTVDRLSSAGSLVRQLRNQAQIFGDRDAFIYLRDGEVEESRLTWAQLERRVLDLAAYLSELASPGERALLLHSPGTEFVVAFMACLTARWIAVPALAPTSHRHLPRLEAIVLDSAPALVLTDSANEKSVQRFCTAVPAAAGLRIIATDCIPLGGSGFAGSEPEGQDLAFLQYTSGSTGQPKGVMVSHGNLIDNLAFISASGGVTSDTRIATWLPQYHDMGLVGGLLLSVAVGATCVQFSPLAFLKKPSRWLEVLSRYRSHLSGGPNFAYDLCLKNLESEQYQGLDLSNWRVAFTGSEPIRSASLDAFARAFAPYGFRKRSFFPCYGMAETTLMATSREWSEAPVQSQFSEADLALGHGVESEGGRPLVGCGRSSPAQTLRVVHPETLVACADGEIGEVWIRGGSVGLGYWQRKEETERTFHARLADSDEAEFLRTGDLGFVLRHELFIAGRIKDLIILRGVNHYPQDIEATVEASHRGIAVASAAAVPLEVDGVERLVVIAEVKRVFLRRDLAAVAVAIRSAVAEWHEVELYGLALLKPQTLPKTSSGKVRRQSCRNAFERGTLSTVRSWVGPELAALTASPPAAARSRSASPKPSPLEDWLRQRLARRIGVEPREVDPETPFSHFGLGSAAVVGLVGELEERLGRRLPATLLFDHPTLAKLTSYLALDPALPALAREREGSGPAAETASGERVEPIAVIGLGCRFPGAANPAAYWSLLEKGICEVREVPKERWDAEAFYDEDLAAPGKMNSRWGGFLEAVDHFDAQFFGIPPREADRMDPQQRLLLEVTWEALEDAGIPPESLREASVGVYVGISTNDYGRLQIGDTQSVDALVGSGSSSSIAANRISYLLGWRGPSLAVDTACSSSLVAVHLACQSLRNGESTLAVAGGVNVILSPEITLSFAKAGLMARDGLCKTFDSRADGYVRSEGCGMILLKPLSKAVADGDRIYGVVRGSAVNQDGATNGLTAPSQRAQEHVMRLASSQGRIDPRDLDYVEAHGTGTALGDQIELQALGQVVGAGRGAGETCAIGSVKSNLGHLEAAAGAAGLIKVLLAFHHGSLPPSLHFREPRAGISPEELGLAVQTQLSPWPRRGEGRALAGVSSFGFGGTNAHLILEEAPVRQVEDPATEGSETAEWQLLPLSAKNPVELGAMAENLADALERDSDVSLGNVAWTLQTGRNAFAHRQIILCRSRLDAVTALRANVPPHSLTYGPAPGKRLVTFLFPGVGDQYPGVGRELYSRFQTFRQQVEFCCSYLKDRMGLDLMPALGLTGPEMPAPGLEEVPGRIDFRAMLGRGQTSPEDSAGSLLPTRMAQPAVFVLEMALVSQLAEWGIRPDRMMGYSLGEYVAACVAGVFSLEDALYLVARRAALISDLPEGAMTAVPLSREKVSVWLGERLSVAAVNGPELTILAGELAAVGEVERSLAERGIPCRRLPATHAFHSVMMEPIRAEFARLVAEVRRRPPQIPYITNVTGTWVTDVEATDPEHWAENLCRTVQFSAGAGLLTRGAESAILELGPGQSLSAAIRQLPECPPDQRAFVLPTLPGVVQKGDGHRILLEALGRLWLAGVAVKWPGLHEAKIRRRIPLPTYPFKRKRHWFEASSGPALKPPSGKRTDLGDWFWIPGWRTTTCLDAAQGSSLPATGDWLLLADEGGVGEHLATALREGGCGVVTLWQRHRGRRLGKNEFELGTAGEGALRSFLERFPAGFERVVHLWSLDAPRFSLHRPVAEILEMGYFSVLDLLQATARQSWNALDLWVVAEGTSQVHGEEVLNPGLAPLQALVRTANQEMPGLQARLVDLEPGAGEVEERGRLLLRELAQKADHPWVAWRGQQRWVESVERVSWSASEFSQGTASAAPDGWIWIVGGLGSIGLQLAEEFAAQGVPLMLTRRSPFPPRELWEEKLQVPGEDQERIRRLLDFEKRGTPVRVAAADARDEVAMERVLREGEAAWGRLRGVVHAAAYLREDGFAAVADLDPHQSELHFAPKIDGTLALARVLVGRSPDFVVLFSSISSLLAGPGLAAYSAANAFQDAFVRSLSNPERQRWLSVNWDTWESPGSSLPGGLGSETAQFSMRSEEGIEVFRRLLQRSAGPQVVVSVGDLDDRLRRWVLDPACRRSPANSVRGGGALHREYVAPTTEMERAITRIWQEILGVERVGIHDNFFELGGQSLLAAQFFALLRQTTRIPADLPLKSLFDAPTPSELAELLGRLGRLAKAPVENLEGAVVGIVEGEL